MENTLKKYDVMVEYHYFIMGGYWEYTYRNIEAKNAGDAIREVFKIDPRCTGQWCYIHTKEVAS